MSSPHDAASADNGVEGEPPPPLSAVAAAQRAVEQFAALTGRLPEAVTGLRPIEGGWSALIDVVELTRVPDSTTVLATYRVDLDALGEMRCYERLRRFHRGATDTG